MVKASGLIVLFFSIVTASGAELYKAMLVRAAPGHQLELIKLYQEHMSYYDDAGDQRPFWMRHSQGDQWDLLMLFPMGSFETYFSPDRIAKRRAAFEKRGITGAQFADQFYRLVSWHEEVFVDGPPLEQVRSVLGPAGFFHVEMFHALAGKQKKLIEQRQMENVYLKELGRPQNLIFTHEQGASWDCFTIGAYRDLKHFAESVDIPEDQEEQAARKAGFESASQIGPYLRTLIADHHDTLAVAIR